jgi:hypothetical protein
MSTTINLLFDPAIFDNTIYDVNWGIQTIKITQATEETIKITQTIED